MNITLVVPSAQRPIGGNAVLYEYANRLCGRGHSVTLVHINFVGDYRNPVWIFDDAITSLDDVGWFAFEPDIRHQLLPDFQVSELPSGDVINLPPLGHELPEEVGQPFLFVQGYQMFSPEFEVEAFRTPAPKICVARWLADVVRSVGSPPHQAVHIPSGIRHDKYRMKTDLRQRPLQVSMLYNAAPTKAANYGVDALALVKSRIPGTRVVVFGGTEPTYEIPDGITYLTAPPQSVIVDDIYNRSRVFINSSIVEGFGVACIEAMACGAALVTTSNGGSDDYAIHGDTALVSEPTDVATMANHIESLLVDDDARIRLARTGREYVRRFDWDESARALEQFLERYLADPAGYQQPASSPSNGAP